MNELIGHWLSSSSVTLDAIWQMLSTSTSAYGKDKCRLLLGLRILIEDRTLFGFNLRFINLVISRFRC
jgi:hypothetical protein